MDGSQEAQDVVQAVYQLLHFTSFFGAAFALNIGYGLLQQIHNSAMTKYRNVKHEKLASWKSQHCEPVEGHKGASKEHERVVREWNESEQEYISFSDGLVTFSRWVAKITALFLLFFLLWIGYYPETKVNIVVICSMVSASILPTLSFFIFLEWYWANKITLLKKEIKQQDDVFKGAERIFNYDKKSDDTSD